MLESQALDLFRRYDFPEKLLRKDRSVHAGSLPSRRNGQNNEFERYGQYHPGDDLRSIDWKVMARTGKAYVRRYGSDIRSHIRVVLDNSQSMDYPEKSRENKHSIAKKTAELLYHLFLNRQDSCLIGALDSVFTRIDTAYPSALSQNLDALSPAGKAELSLLPVLDKGQTGFFITDGWLMADAEELGNEISSRGYHLVLVLTPEEAELELRGDFRLLDSEGMGSVDVLPSRLRETYKRLMNERRLTLHKTLARKGLALFVVRTDKPYYVTLKDQMEQFRRSS